MFHCIKKKNSERIRFMPFPRFKFQFNNNHSFAYSIQLHYFTFSNPIQIILKQIYLTHTRYLIGTSTTGQSGPGSNGNERVLHTHNS